MANEYEFGGTNGVAAQDFGQKNGTMWSADPQQANWVIKVALGSPQQAKVRNAITQQSVLFIDDLGFRGRVITFTGFLRIDTRARWETIESNLCGVNSGQTMHEPFSGIRGPVDPTLLAPTRLRDGAPEILTENAVLWNYGFGGARSLLNSGFTIIVPLTVLFLDLG